MVFIVRKSFVYLPPLKRDVAQLVECTSGGREAAGSSPVIPTFSLPKEVKSLSIV